MHVLFLKFWKDERGCKRNGHFEPNSFTNVLPVYFLTNGNAIFSSDAFFLHFHHFIQHLRIFFF